MFRWILLAQAAQPSPLNQSVTIQFNIGTLIAVLIVGLVAGFVASLLVRGRGFGMLGSLVLGVLGALVGSFLFSMLNIQVSGFLLDGITIRMIDLLVAFIGALSLLAIYVLIFGRRRL